MEIDASRSVREGFYNFRRPSSRRVGYNVEVEGDFYSEVNHDNKKGVTAIVGMTRSPFSMTSASRNDLLKYDFYHLPHEIRLTITRPLSGKDALR